jgi:protease-4
MLRLDRPLQPAAEQLLQSSVNHNYAEFLQRVASGRHKSTADIDAIAQGRVWAGSDALRIGLIDRLGSYQDALASAAQRAKLGKGYEVRVIEPDLSVAQQLLLSLRGSLATLLHAVSSSSSPVTRLAASLEPLQPLQRELLRWRRLAESGAAQAYCFCTVH